MYTRDCVGIEPVSHVNHAFNLMALSGATANEPGMIRVEPLA